MQKEADVRACMDEVTNQLQQALFQDQPDYAASLKSSLRVIRGASVAYLWHHVVFFGGARRLLHRP